jgi:hypothetical protein
MTSNSPREHTATQGTTASRAYAQQAVHALHVTRDALNDEDPAGIDVRLRTADVYARLAQAGLAFSGRRAKLHLQDTWPWTEQLLAAFQKLKALAPITA